MAGFETYQGLMADWAGDFMRPYMESKPPLPLPDPSKKFLNKLFYGFIEISDTYDALVLAQNLVKLAPPRSKRIKRDQYLKYHINAYLQEVYILKERLNAYATALGRAYRGSEQEATFDRETEGLFQLVRQAFRGLVDTRGAHVHAQRFSDQDLDRLTSLGFISLFKEDFVDEAHFEYRWISLRWSDTIKQNNEQTLKVLDTYFDQMKKAISSNGEVFTPPAVRPNRGD